MVRGQTGGERKLFAARTAFAFIENGVHVVVNPGDVVDAGDPILKGREALFDEFAPRVRNYPGRIEQATAAPGEKRG